MQKTRTKKNQATIKKSFSSSLFLRNLLVQCIGTVMIEGEQWNFSDDELFHRAYFNDRIKQDKAVNVLTHKRLSFLFFHLFFPEKRKNSKFQEPQAVDGANALISLLQETFHVDFSFLNNSYAKDNTVSRKKLLEILELVLNLVQNCVTFDSSLIADVLFSKQQELLAQTDLPSSYFPVFLNALPPAKAEYFIDRAETENDVVSLLCSGTSCFLHGIGGIGKTELAKDVVKKICQIPSKQSGITHIAWIDYVENSLRLSLIRGLGISKSNAGYEELFQSALRILQQYGSSLLLIFDNVENGTDADLDKISSFLSCRLLVSSRVEGFPNLRKIPVRELSDVDCKDLFYHYYHGLKDDTSLQKIIQLTDCHTVTVELLAKLADTEEDSLSEFLRKLKMCGFSFSEEEVASSHEKLQREEQMIRQLLNLFYVCDCSESERQLLIQISVLPSLPFDFKKVQTWFHLKNKTALNQLVKKGWLKKTPHYENGTYSHQYMIHSVVASAVRAQFQPILYQSCHSFLVYLTKEILQHPSQVTTHKKELIQFGWSLNDLFSNDFHTQDDAEFLYAIAEIYRDSGYYTRAISLLERLLCLYENLYGKDSRPCVSVYHSLSLLYYETFQLQKAFHFSQRCYDLFSEKYEEESASITRIIDMAAIQLNLGKIYLNTDYKKAKPYLDHSYDLLEKKLGFSDLLTLNSYMYLGIFHIQSGNSNHAKEIFQTIYHTVGKDASSFTGQMLRANTSYHLAILCVNSSPDKALPFFKEALTLYEDLLPSEHPSVINLRSCLAAYHFALKHHDPELVQKVQSLPSPENQLYDRQKPNMPSVYNDLGFYYCRMKQDQETAENRQKMFSVYDSLPEENSFFLNHNTFPDI